MVPSLCWQNHELAVSYGSYNRTLNDISRYLR